MATFKKYCAAGIKVAVKAGIESIPGGRVLTAAGEAIELVKNAEKDQAFDNRLSQVERAMQQVLADVCRQMTQPNLGSDSVDAIMRELRELREANREPFLSQGMFVNCASYNHLMQDPTEYGEVLEYDVKLDLDPRHYYLFLDLDKSRVLKMRAGQVRSLLQLQQHGVPPAEVVGSGSQLLARRTDVDQSGKPTAATATADPTRIITPEPKRLIVPGADLPRAAVRLWAQPHLVHRLQGHTSMVHAASFSPDGRQVLTGSWDSTARLWEVATGRELRRLEGHAAGFVNAASFSPDGRQVVTGGPARTARLWDAVTGRELRRLEGHMDFLHSVSFSPDGRQVVTGSWDTTARLWEVATGRELRRLEGHTDRVWCASFSPDGRQVVTGSWDTTARLWEMATGRELRRLEGHASVVSAASFSPDGRQVVTGSDDFTARLWEVATGRERLRLEGHTKSLSAAFFLPDGRHVVTGSWDNTLCLWEVDTARELARIDAGQRVCAAAFSPDGRTVVLGVGTFDKDPAKCRGEAQIWQVAE
jgi:WD40 repeat protein